MATVQNGGTYQWLDCENDYTIIPNETNQTYTPSAITGEYAAEITLNSCVDTSFCKIVDRNGLEHSILNNFSVYPNPATDKITVEWSAEVSISEVLMLDARGRTIQVIDGFTDKRLEISLNNLANGVYFINVASENEQQIIKFVKQ